MLSLKSLHVKMKKIKKERRLKKVIVFLKLGVIHDE